MGNIEVVGGSCQDVFEQFKEGRDQIFWVCELDPERVVHVSDRFEDVWGVKAEQIYEDSRVWLQCIHPEDRLVVTNAFESWLLGKHSEFCVEYRVVRPDGEVRWILDRGVIREKRAGGGGLASRIARDITEDKKAADALQAGCDAYIPLSDDLDASVAGSASDSCRRKRPVRIVGKSPAIVATMKQVSHVAQTDATVLILGETGVGKELFAKQIHQSSPRRKQPFVRVNCAALPNSLIESELFGHLKGAFTGALSDRIGRFEAAKGGTIFLDEIGELDLNLQSKLLHVLQEGELERIGSSETIQVDVRVVAATNRDLSSIVDQGLFRADLYFRLAVFPIVVPPLRERREDIPLLVWNCLRNAKSVKAHSISYVAADAIRRLVDYDWPGNIRQLENVVMRAVIMSTDVNLMIDLPDEQHVQPGVSHSSDRSLIPANAEMNEDLDIATLDDVERRHIMNVLQKCSWKIKGPRRAADCLGMAPSTLRYRMRKLGIKRPSVAKPR